MKLLVVGHGRHGKDTFCELSGLPFQSSSEAALDIVIWPYWGCAKYETKAECFEDRSNHRSTWYNMIKAYNNADKTSLATKILVNSDIYCGMRNREELHACNTIGLFDAIIWVDASDRLPPEPASSMTITRDDCGLFVDNNGPEKDFEAIVLNTLAEIGGF